MGKSQPTYTKEFKQKAVELFQTSGKTKTQIARDLEINGVKSLGSKGKKHLLEKATKQRLKRKIKS